MVAHIFRELHIEATEIFKIYTGLYPSQLEDEVF
jgi:hypothetical protein